MITSLRYQFKDIKRKIALLKKNNDLDAIPPILIELLIVGEDHRYSIHPGVDPIAICRAIYKSLLYGKREGGSTIAMQLVRVITGKYEKTILRKLNEIFLAIMLSNILTKDELPKIYLAVAYYGWNMNGIHQACRRLELDYSKMSNEDAAAIIARLKYPEPCKCSQPRKDKILNRAKHIIFLLQKNKFNNNAMI